MPQVTEIPFDQKFISLSVERDAIRSSGVHLSHVIKDMLLTAGIERKVKGKEFTEEERNKLFNQGFLWERLVHELIETPEWIAHEWDSFVVKGLAQISQDSIDKSGGSVIRPGECMLDGIYMTPDAINLPKNLLEEWKACGIKSYNFILKERKPEWLWQVGAYLKVLGLTRAIIRIWHYSQVPPVVTQHVVDFTQEELDKNWNTIYKHYQFMQNRKK